MNFLRKIQESDLDERMTPLFAGHLKELRTEGEKIGGRELAHMIFRASSLEDQKMTREIMDQILQKSRTKEEIFTYIHQRDGILPGTLHQTTLLMIACALKKEEIALFLFRTPFHNALYERSILPDEPKSAFEYAFQGCMEELLIEILDHHHSTQTGKPASYLQSLSEEAKSDLFQRTCQKHMKRLLTYLVSQQVFYPSNTSYAEVLYMGDERTALKMIQSGEINPFYIDRRGKSPLIYAIEKKMMRLFEYYVEECPLSHFTYGEPSPVDLIKKESALVPQGGAGGSPRVSPPTETTRAMRAFISKRYKEPPRFIIIAGEHTIVVNKPMGKKK